MSQTGKQFLTGLMNRVFGSEKESRATKQRREQSLSARRLGMEPLEDRQLLAAVNPFDVPADAADANIDEPIAISVAAAVPVANAVEATSANTSLDDLPSVAISAGLDRERTGWQASLANILATVGWGDAKAVLVSQFEDQQDVELTIKEKALRVYNYIDRHFSNEQSSVLAGFSWYMNGSDAYIYNGQPGWASVIDETGGNLFPSTTGEFMPYSYYAKQEDAAKYSSPLIHIQTNYLLDDANSYGIGIEVRYADASGKDIVTDNRISSQRKTSWLTLWGLKTDQNVYDDEGNIIDRLNASDPRCVKSVVVSDPLTGSIETYDVTWDASKHAYTFDDYGRLEDPYNPGHYLATQTPYLSNFTIIQARPGYTGDNLDAYDPNETAEDFDVPGCKSDLGVIDEVEASFYEGDSSKGNTIVLNDLSLDAHYDPVDFYRFELSAPGSNADAIELIYSEGTINSAITMTLMKCADDGSILPLSSAELGFVEGKFDPVSSKYVEYTTDPTTGKTFRAEKIKETIKISGLPAGKYYLRVQFKASDPVNEVNRGYSLQFRAGFDDVYETNDSYEDVATLPVTSKDNPTANLGVLEPREGSTLGGVTLSDLVLKQYDRNVVSETDWFRFETLGEGLKVTAIYQSTFQRENDGDLDIWLYKEDPSDPRGYRFVQKSEYEYFPKDSEREVIDIPDAEAGVYYVKVVGFKGAGNLHYKLDINA
ncbi:MAG: hypothetical protein HUK22_08735, partial [Thermoguttaceae bacterium]|nr:hypothetical protein [Thermoguttaceae bacterium]